MAKPARAELILETLVVVIGAVVMTGMAWGAFFVVARYLSGDDAWYHGIGWLFLGGVLFPAYAPALLAYSKAARGDMIAGVAMYGVTFPIWCFTSAFTVIGIFGVAQAIITGWWLGTALRSKLLGIAPLLTLAPAWSCAYAVSDEFGVVTMLAVGVWNLNMAGVMAVWATRTRLILPSATPTCESCGYNLTGIESIQCPECGHASRRICHECGGDIRGLDAPRCPHCGKPVSHKRRRKSMICPQCGYSLVGLPTNQCPECGRLARINSRVTTPPPL